MVYLKELMSNVFFRKYFITDYVLNFIYRMFNEKFLLTRIYNDNKTKVKVLSKVILRVRYIAHVNLIAFVPARARAIARVSWNSMY